VAFSGVVDRIEISNVEFFLYSTHQNYSNQFAFLMAFGALMPLVEWQKEHPACKILRVVECWRGYLSGARCRLAYGPADATATHCLLLQYNADWFYFFCTGLSR